jgi:hypothetical protein
MGDWLVMFEDLIASLRHQAPELADRLAVFLADARAERAIKDWAIIVAMELEDRQEDVARLESLAGWATAVSIGAAAEAPRVLAMCRQGSQECSVCPVTACCDNTFPAATAIKDLRMAARELLVPEPGTDMARLLSANILLRREMAECRSELTTARLVASESVAILQRLQEEEGLDLDADVLLLMARVRVASGGGCGTCPLRVTVAVDFIARRGTSPVWSTCRHPGAGQAVPGQWMVPDVTKSQQEAGPPPGWCPLRGQPDDREEDHEPDASPGGRTSWGQVTQ